MISGLHQVRLLTLALAIALVSGSLAAAESACEDASQWLSIGPKDVLSASGARLSCPEEQTLLLDLELGPEQQRELAIELRNADDRERKFRVELGNGEAPGWLDLSPDQGTIAPGESQMLNATIVANPLTAIDGSLSETLEINIEAAEEVMTLKLTIEVRIGNDDPLFRDTFDVEPVIGQFN